MIEGTGIYHRLMTPRDDDDERSDLLRRVWSATPWIVDVHTIDEETLRRIRHWCHDTFGEECRPLRERPGRWQVGCVTIFGWTWFGFADEPGLQAFCAVWETRHEPDAFAGAGNPMEVTRE